MGGREGMCRADTVGNDEFGTMESPDGAWEGQAVSPTVVRELDVPCKQHSLPKRSGYSWKLSCSDA